MTKQEINTLIRPYIKRLEAKREVENTFAILAFLWLGCLSAAFALVLAFVLHF